MTTKLDNDTLEWAARWIQDSLKGEANERVIEFGNNMAMTIRAAVQPAASTPTLEDILRERQAVGAVTMVGDVNITAAASTEPVYGSGREFMLNSRFNDPVVSTEAQEEKE